MRRLALARLTWSIAAIAAAPARAQVLTRDSRPDEHPVEERRSDAAPAPEKITAAPERAAAPPPAAGARPPQRPPKSSAGAAAKPVADAPAQELLVAPAPKRGTLPAEQESAPAAPRPRAAETRTPRVWPPLSRPGAPSAPAARAAPPPPRAASAPAPAPAPLRSRDQFVRDSRRPPAPTVDGRGARVKALPFQRPPDSRAVFEDRALQRRLDAERGRESERSRYYWHDAAGLRYCHYQDDAGRHWYGFYMGRRYYWCRLHAGRWWWYDPRRRIWTYYAGGAWWWQDPDEPETLYAYGEAGYVPYGTAEQPAAPAEIIESAATPEPRTLSEADAPNYEALEDADSFAVVIGVESYARLPKAEFAARDAEAVRAHLARLGYPEANTVVMTDDEATLANVEKYLETWLRKAADSDSRVFVYFAGRGSSEARGGESYLLPWDGQTRFLEDTAYPLRRLYEKLNALPAREIVVVLDAAFAGGRVRAAPTDAPHLAAARPDLGRRALGRLVVFTAAAADQDAGVAADQGHGLFTYYFLEGLNGGARADSNGVTAQELYDFLAPSVEDEARRDGREQNPQILVPPDGRRRTLIKDLR